MLLPPFFCCPSLTPAHRDGVNFLVGLRKRLSRHSSAPPSLHVGGQVTMGCSFCSAPPSPQVYKSRPQQRAACTFSLPVAGWVILIGALVLGGPLLPYTQTTVYNVGFMSYKPAISFFICFTLHVISQLAHDMEKQGVIWGLC